MRARVVVPATSANLGPGYDAFGLALDLHNVFEGELASEWRVEARGEGADQLPRGAENHVAQAAARAFAEVGRIDLRATIRCEDGIPVGRGLGSSSAAIVGGLMLGCALAGVRLTKARLLELAAELEGHADNAAAALHGGFTVSAGEPGGVRCVRLDPAGGLAAIVVIGERELPTTRARGVLPEMVPHADAAANAGRAALVALGLAMGDNDALALGLRDALHEPYRASLIPDLEAARAVLAEAGAGSAVLSGAGPSIIALVQDSDDERALERARALADVARPGLAAIGRHRVLALGIDRVGARLA